jgi:hypothetical protein
VFDGTAEQAEADRYAWYDNFFVDFFTTDGTLGSRLSEAALRANWGRLTRHRDRREGIARRGGLAPGRGRGADRPRRGLMPLPGLREPPGRASRAGCLAVRCGAR